MTPRQHPATGDEKPEPVFCPVCEVYDCHIQPENAHFAWATIRALRHIDAELAREFAADLSLRQVLYRLSE